MRTQERYGRSTISSFTRSQRNIGQVPRMRKDEVEKAKQNDLLPSSLPDESIDLFYQFFDGPEVCPAFLFHEEEEQEEDEERMYRLLWVDPSIQTLWQEHVQREERNRTL